MKEDFYFNNGERLNNADTNQSVNNVDAWKLVTLGGVSGVFMGAGLMYSSGLSAKHQEKVEESMTSEVPSDAKVEVSEVSDDLSFGEAFAAARAEVGPGGVFYWHGGIYNTYTAEEWNSMSQVEKNDFAQQIRPEIPPHNIQTPTDENPNIVHYSDADDVSLASNNSSDDGDVHIVGYANVQGHLAVGLDTTGDGDADVAIIDVDDNRHMSDADVVVDTYGHIATVGEIINGSEPPIDTYSDNTNMHDTDNLDADVPLFEC